MFENESLIEIAIELMEKKKRKPHTLIAIAKDIFEIKNIKLNDEKGKEILSQFAIDFMLSGYFICCGEDKKGNKLWDLKNRQKHEFQDKEAVYLEDIYENDEDVKKNELKDDIYYEEDSELNYETDEEDDLDDEEKEDDIAEELKEFDPNIKVKLISEDDDTDDSFDDEDD